MSFWSKLFGPPPNHDGIAPNGNEPPPYPETVSETGWRPGEPGAIEWDPVAPRVAKPEDLCIDVSIRSSGGGFSPSPWSGWPAEWSTPNFGMGPDFGRLVDAAWSCLDLNASVISSMPPYILDGNQVDEDPPGWLRNPDPSVYASWEEFAKQVFWDFQNGEVFILATACDDAGYPASFRVIPPWMVNAELSGDGTRRYAIGGLEVTGNILHIRYQSTTEDARGHGPLEVGGARMIAAGVLAQYVKRLAETGGQTHEWLEIERQLTKSQADDLLDQYVASRMRNLGHPGVVSGGAQLKQSLSMSAKDMALLELSQYSESRIAVLLGVPPFLVGLPSGGDSMTYSNSSSLFDFHYRSSLRPKGRTVMAALTQWLLPDGRSLEVNHEDYTRPSLPERATAYATLHNIQDETGRAVSAEEIRTMERMRGTTPAGTRAGVDAGALTGGEGVDGADQPADAAAAE